MVTYLMLSGTDHQDGILFQLILSAHPVTSHSTVVQVRHPLPTLQIAATSSRPSLILPRAPFQALMRRCLL